MPPSGNSTLLGSSGGNSAVPGAIYIRLSQDALNLLASSTSNPKVQLTLSKSSAPTLKIGSSVFESSCIPEPSPLEVYSSSSSSASTYAHLGTITSRMTLRSNTSANTNVASKLKSQNSAFQKEKDANKATLLTAAPVASKPRKTTTGAMRKSPPSGLGLLGTQLHGLSNGNGGSGGPVSATSALGGSSAVGGLSDLGLNSGPKSLPVSPSHSEMTGSKGSSKRVKQNLSSLPLLSAPMRVLHFLALGPTSPKTVAARTNLPLAEVDAILSQYAKQDPSNTANVVLADSTYKDLRIWDWNHYSNIDRKKVVADAVAAYNRLKYPADHPARLALEKPKPTALKDPAQLLATGRSIVRPASANSASTASLLASPLSPSTNGKATANSETSTSGSATSADASSVSSSKRPKTKLSGVSSLPPKPQPPKSPTKLSSQNQNQNQNHGQNQNTSPNYIASSATNSPSRDLSTSKPSSPMSVSSSTSGAKRKFAATAASVDADDNVVVVEESLPKNRKIDSASSAESGKVLMVQPNMKKSQLSTSIGAILDEAELFDLAQKFKDTYSEYEKLYKTVSKRQRKPKDQLQKLLSMHRDLASWKQKLWASAQTRSRTGEAA